MALGNILGGNEQAMLIVDINKKDVPIADPAPPTKLSQMKKKADEAKAMAERLQNLGGDGMQTPQGCLRYFFYTQYNPQNLLINGEKDIDYYIDLEQKAGDSQVTIPKGIGINELQFTLIFDQATLADAFTLEIANAAASLNPTFIAKTALGMALPVMTGSPRVKDYIEAIYSCIGNQKVERVFFLWGTYIFSGLFFRANTRYTMFDKYGNPVRAELDLTLRQNDKIECWSKDLNKVFNSSATYKMLANMGALGLGL
ncbi:MAG: hypothetical protein K6F52_06780 [Clostridia bacterium]|nr:hypothetical protein [Clostridia bacterium]